MQITNSQPSFGSSEFVDWAPDWTPQDENSHQLIVSEHQSHNLPHETALANRQVAPLHRASLSENTTDVFTRATDEYWRRYSQTEDDKDDKNYMNAHIRAGRDDHVAELIQQGYPLDPDDDNIAAPMVTAATYGSAKALLTLLRHGADPNSYSVQPTPMGLCAEHVLQMTDDIDKIVLLLSYGADTRPMAIGWAFAHEHPLHLLVYFHWQQYCQQHGHQIARPETVDQLNGLVAQLPVSEIQSTVALFEHNQWSVNYPPEPPPHGLEAFWSFLKGPV